MARNVGAKKIKKSVHTVQNRRGYSGNPEIGMWKTGSVENSPISLINLIFFLSKSFGRVQSSFHIFYRVAGNGQKQDFLGPKVGKGK